MIWLMSTLVNAIGDFENLTMSEKIMKFTKRKLNNLNEIKVI